MALPKHNRSFNAVLPNIGPVVIDLAAYDELGDSVSIETFDQNTGETVYSGPMNLHPAYVSREPE